MPGTPRTLLRDEIGQVVADSQTAAAAVATATLAAVAGKRNYVTGLCVSGLGATAATGVEATLTGLGTTLKFVVPVVAGVGLGNTPVVLLFGDGIPASADNTAIVLSVPSYGSGNTKSDVALWGFVA